MKRSPFNALWFGFPLCNLVLKSLAKTKTLAKRMCITQPIFWRHSIFIFCIDNITCHPMMLTDISVYGLHNQD